MDRSQIPEASTLPASPELLSTKVESADEVSLFDILRFLRRQFKVICGVTVATVLVGLGSGLAAAPQSQRELLLKLTLSPELLLNANIAGKTPMIWDDISTASSQALSQDLPERMSTLTQSSPIKADLSTATAIDPAASPDRLQVVLTSEDALVLEAASQPTLEILEETADEVAESVLEPEIARLDLLIQRVQAKIDQLERRLASSEPLPSEDSVTFSGFLELQQKSQQQLLLAQEFSRLADYELEYADLSALKASNTPLVSIDILLDTQTQEGESLVRSLILSAIAGFMLGILVALIVDQLPQIRTALSTPDK